MQESLGSDSYTQSFYTEFSDVSESVAMIEINRDLVFEPGGY